MELLVFGRKTYEGMAGYWQAETGEIADRMNTQAKVVISNTLARADWNNTRLVRGEAREAIATLKGEAKGDIYIFGSAELVAPLLAAGLDLTALEEHDSVPWNALPGQMCEIGGGEFRLADRPERLPHTYTLQARKRG